MKITNRPEYCYFGIKMCILKFFAFIGLYIKWIKWFWVEYRVKAEQAGGKDER